MALIREAEPIGDLGEIAASREQRARALDAKPKHEGMGSHAELPAKVAQEHKVVAAHGHRELS